MRLRWTRRTLADLEEARTYIAQHRPAASAEIADGIRRAVEMLTRHPEIGRIGRVPDTRELVVTGTPFLVAYRVGDAAIDVLAVLPGARRWPDRL